MNGPSLMRGWCRLATGAMAAAVLTLAAGCGNNEAISAGTEGSNEQAGEIRVRNLLVAAPPDGRYEPGDTAIARVTLLNNSAIPQRMTAASDVADRVLVRSGECPLPTTGSMSVSVPPAPDQPVPSRPSDADVYWLEVVGLREEILAGGSLPIAFTFELAGRVSVDALVQSTGGDRPVLDPAEQCVNGSG